MTLLHHLQPICAEALGLHGCNLTLPLTHRHPGAALQHNWGDPSASRALGSATYRLHEDFMRLTKKKYKFEISCFKYENTNLKGDIQQRCLHSSSHAHQVRSLLSKLLSHLSSLFGCEDDDILAVQETAQMRQQLSCLQQRGCCVCTPLRDSDLQLCSYLHSLRLPAHTCTCTAGKLVNWEAVGAVGKRGGLGHCDGSMCMS
jgi:hypothetical protein